MPGYTPRFKIPYPLDGDPIYLGASQMKALATRVDETMGAVEGGATGPPGTPGELIVPKWEVINVQPKDEVRNTALNMGAGGYCRVRGRVVAGVKYVELEMKWGTNPRSSGGSVYIDLPAKWANDGSSNGALNIERIGLGKYHHPKGGDWYDWPCQPWIGAGGRRIYFLVPWYGSACTLRRFRIWDGRNGENTGFPFIDGRHMDEPGCHIQGTLSYPA